MTIKEHFDLYHQQNPHVYDLFLRYARMAKAKGFSKFSAKAIFERLRWHFTFETTGDKFLLNNNYTALYARKAMEEHSDFAGFFELRERARP